jgi:hypothetical protein
MQMSDREMLFRAVVHSQFRFTMSETISFSRESAIDFACIL